MPSHIGMSAVDRRKWPSQSKGVLGADRQKSQEGRFQHYIGKHFLAIAVAQRWNEYPTRDLLTIPRGDRGHLFRNNVTRAMVRWGGD